MQGNNEIFYHCGMMRTGTTYLQRTVFPYFKGIRYVPKRQYFERDEIIRDSAASRFLISYELAMDDQWEREINNVSEEWPDTTPIVVIRRHSDWLLSEYKRQLKNGYIRHFHQLWSEDDKAAQYQKEDLMYCRRVAFLREKFNNPPVILKYSDMQHDPLGFVHSLAGIVDATFDPADIDLRWRHTSYGDRELRALRHVMKFVNLNRERANQHPALFRLVRLLRDTVRYGILHTASLLPGDTHLVPKQVLDHVDEVYRKDWETILIESEKSAPHNLS
ncbi:MAG: hypothetical protein R3330_00615 [Saprospiraceae bacterium]|nr:hypothetical protein [Saprospiraceae bacterium]